MTPRLLRIVNVFWGQVVVAIAAFAGVRIYTEMLDKNAFGQAMLLVGVIALLDSLVPMALNQTLLSRCGPLGDTEARRQLAVGLARILIRWIVVVLSILGLIAGFGMWLFDLDPIPASLALPLMAYLAAEACKYSLVSLVVLERRYGVYSFWMGGEALLTLGGSVVSMLLWRMDALGFLMGNITARVLSTGLFILILSPRHLIGIDLATARAALKPALNYGLPVSVMGPLGWVSTYLDRYILGLLLGTAATGGYVAVTGLVARPYALTTSVLSNYFRPLYFQPDLPRQGAVGCRRILRAWLFASLGIGLLGTALFGLLGDFVASLMLAIDYREGATLLMVLFGLSQTFAISTHASDNAILALRGSGSLLNLQILLSLGTLILIPVGIWMGGLVGGVIGRILAEALKFFATLALALLRIRQMDGMAGIVGQSEAAEKR